jgi:hypothetical protein
MRTRTVSKSLTRSARCGARMRILAFIIDPAVIRQILDHLDPRASPRAPPGSSRGPLTSTLGLCLPLIAHGPILSISCSSPTRPFSADLDKLLRLSPPEDFPIRSRGQISYDSLSVISAPLNPRR